MKKNNKGFTLAELLIVVAIIAVLVAIAIPIFTAQLEKSRDAVTASNLRAAYAEAAAEVLMDANTNASADIAKTKEVDVKGTQPNGAFADDSFDFPFTIADAAQTKLDSPKADKVSVVFTWKWDATNKTLANEPEVTIGG